MIDSFLADYHTCRRATAVPRLLVRSLYARSFVVRSAQPFAACRCYPSCRSVRPRCRRSAVHACAPRTLPSFVRSLPCPVQRSSFVPRRNSDYLATQDLRLAQIPSSQPSAPAPRTQHARPACRACPRLRPARRVAQPFPVGYNCRSLDWIGSFPVHIAQHAFCRTHPSARLRSVRPRTQVQPSTTCRLAAQRGARVPSTHARTHTHFHTYFLPSSFLPSASAVPRFHPVDVRLIPRCRIAQRIRSDRTQIRPFVDGSIRSDWINPADYPARDSHVSFVRTFVQRSVEFVPS